MLRSLGFTGKGARSPLSTIELGGDLVSIRSHGGSVDVGVVKLHESRGGT